MSETAADSADMIALQKGDATALDRLMHRWQVRLRSFLLRHLVSQTDALDIAQETFVRIYRHRDRFDHHRRFSTWMFQIALNLVRDQSRRRARRPTTMLSDAPELISERTPHHGAEATETAIAVRAAIADLTPPLREVIILFEYEHLSHAEIAEIIDATPKAVETRLYRARAQLRTTLTRWLEP